MHDANILVGMKTGDDAGVYRLSDDLAVIQTVDFITPIVDDPYTFGQIAAANSLSDVYAMGGRPVTAMNVVCFPVDKQDISVLGDVLRGGLDKVREAGAALVGGHSVSDDELKFGLSVTGIVHPTKIVTKIGARPGDMLVLTKPIGTGIVTTALKGGVYDDDGLSAIISSMTCLNKLACELMVEASAHACTDITGFGLLGHASGMIADSRLGMEINLPSIPVFPQAREYAAMGLVPGGTRRNRDFYLGSVESAAEMDDIMLDILFDPQTSGGLLIAVPGDKAEELVKKMHNSNISDAAIIGRITDEPKGKIVLRG